MEAVPANMKYAHVEGEQRFLLAAIPAQLNTVPSSKIHDRYLGGTQLRLRAVEEPGRDSVLKLGQKIRMEGDPPMAVAHTTMYLDRADYDALLILPAAELHKSRRVLHLSEMTLAVDEFHGDLEGLVLAEVDLGKHGEPITELPIPYLAKVTRDERFTGGMLAVTRPDALSSLLSEFAQSSTNDAPSTGEPAIDS
jgi:CYTH domain-containing protein